MTGDGVNDVMALKQADCSIAMGSGAQAALAVSSFVLLNNQFSVLPRIVLEGRRVVNNIQRTASLFLVKTIFSFILCVLTVLWMRSYPFIPIQLTLVSSLGTGIPAFILTFENDTKRIQGNFLVSVLSRATPGALSVCLSIATATFYYAAAMDSYGSGGVPDDLHHSRFGQRDRRSLLDLPSAFARASAGDYAVCSRLCRGHGFRAVSVFAGRTESDAADCGRRHRPWRAVCAFAFAESRLAPSVRPVSAFLSEGRKADSGPGKRV